LSAEHEQYLISRGYTNKEIFEEPIQTLPPGTHRFDEIEVRSDHPLIAWHCFGMSTQQIGIQTRRTDVKEYRWFLHPKALHLPIIYGSTYDFDKLYSSGTMVLTEGIFDRIAIKRALPHHAVFARLSKGAGLQLTHFIKRYAKTLWLAFDMDSHGESGTEKATAKLTEHLEVHQLRYPAHDPSELLKSKGPIRTAEIIRRQVEALETTP
jgi:hypothetical protein